MIITLSLQMECLSYLFGTMYYPHGLLVAKAIYLADGNLLMETRIWQMAYMSILWYITWPGIITVTLVLFCCIVALLSEMNTPLRFFLLRLSVW